MNIDKVLDKHFKYHQMIIDNYAKRKESDVCYKKAQEACVKQIEMSPIAREAFLKDETFGFLPEHTGYKQLAIILGKEGYFEEAIKISQMAKTEGWGGDWDKRIARYEKKLLK